MSKGLERCCDCDEPTGRAGRADDSLYTDEGKGPYCPACWDKNHGELVETMSDLKLIDELLLDLKDALRTDWSGVHGHSSITRAAMDRLASAKQSGEIEIMTLSLRNYLERIEAE